MVRLDVYGANAHCVDGQLAAGAGAPILSHSYAQGQAITLDVPPGPHAIVLSTFADTDGTQLLGQGCTEADLSAGSQICFDLTIEPAPDGGDDLSGAGLLDARPTTARPAQYCAGLACVPGCKSDGDCPQHRRRHGGLRARPRIPAAHSASVNADCGRRRAAPCCNGAASTPRATRRTATAAAWRCTGANTQCCNSACVEPARTTPTTAAAAAPACSTLNAMARSAATAMCALDVQRRLRTLRRRATPAATPTSAARQEAVRRAACRRRAAARRATARRRRRRPPATMPASARHRRQLLLRAQDRLGGVRRDLLQRDHGTCTANGCETRVRQRTRRTARRSSNGCETNLAYAGQKLCGARASPPRAAARRRLHDAAGAGRLLRQPPALRRRRAAPARTPRTTGSRRSATRPAATRRLRTCTLNARRAAQCDGTPTPAARHVHARRRSDWPTAPACARSRVRMRRLRPDVLPTASALGARRDNAATLQRAAWPTRPMPARRQAPLPSHRLQCGDARLRARQSLGYKV